MAEYIDLETALREAESRIMWGASSTAVYESIRDATAADVAPVRHGRWMAYSDCGVTRCSVCDWSIEECVDYKYCPNCGARMDGDE